MAGVNVSDLPKHLRDQIEAEHGRAVGPRGKPSRSEAGPSPIGRCIPADGSGCDWTGPYGAGWERHVKATGHHRLELIDTEDQSDA